jgi:hypothetical protein
MKLIGNLTGVFCRCAFKSKNYVGRLDKCYIKPIHGVFAAGDPGLQGQAFSQQLHELGVTSHDAVGLCLQDQDEIERTKPVGFLIIGMQGMRGLDNFAWAQLHARYEHTLQIVFNKEYNVLHGTSNKTLKPYIYIYIYIYTCNVCVCLFS